MIPLFLGLTLANLIILAVVATNGFVSLDESAAPSAFGTHLILGVASAYFGGRFDLIFQRLVDIFMAFP